MNPSSDTPAPRDLDASSPEFEELVARCLEAYDSKGAPALEALCTANPQHAARLRARVVQLVGIGMLAPKSGDASPPFPERLGEFRLLEQLGGGGMGIVFLARQEPLGREVALKLIRPDMLYFPGTRARFQREVETIARLQHPGIVPIHTVGEENGIPYFAMERVRGCGVDGVVRRLQGRAPERLKGTDVANAIHQAIGSPGPEGDTPEAFRGSYETACLRIVIQVAEALDHAHRHGIVHRDVKPSNVMLTPSGRAMLLDFGLAAADGANRLTRTGTALGSLHYMPPEQAQGDVREPDARCDVYSLGVTLYEMLTLFPPYHGDSAHEVLAQITMGDPAPPRVRNPAISWEAETVCLKALDVTPSRRYGDAAAFAKDLRNVLEHRPIAARRAGPLRQFRRFCRRRPALATSILLAPTLVIGALAVLFVQERGARQRIEAKNRIAEKHFAKALEAVDEMLAEVGSEHLRKVPQTEAIRRRLLEKALRFYDGYLAERSDDDDLRRRAAKVRERAGVVQHQLGDLARAERSYRDALAELARLEAASPGDRFVAMESAICRKSLANTLRALAKDDEARAEARAAIAAIEPVATRKDSTPVERGEHADCLLALGVLERRHDPAIAEKSLRDAVSLLDDLAAREPSALIHRGRLARAHNTLGVVLEGRGDESGAVAEYRLAAERFEELVDAEPDDPAHRYQLAGTFENLGTITFGQGPEGEATVRRAIVLQRNLVADFPRVPDYEKQLGATLYNLGYLLATVPTRLDEARGHYLEALERARKLAAAHPADVEYAGDLSRCVDAMCRIERTRKDYAAAEIHGREAVELRRAAVALQPGSAWPLHDLGGALNNLAVALQESGRLAEARPLYAEAITAQDAALTALPDSVDCKRFLRIHYFGLAQTEKTLGDLPAAVATTERLIARLADVGRAYASAASLYAQFGAEAAGEDEEQTAAWNARAIDLIDQAVAKGFTDLGSLRSDVDNAPLCALPGFAEREARAAASSGAGTR